MDLLTLIVLLPLAGFLLNGLVGPRAGKGFVSVVGCGLPILAFLASLRAVSSLDGGDAALMQTAYTWANVGGFPFEISFWLDRLSAVMILIVTGVGSLIHVYSTGYMKDDASYARYFAYLNLFLFFMLLLVLGRSLLVTFVGWEGVGLASYLLIGFWFEDPEKAAAGKKAFITNRVGDAGFLLGMFLIYHVLGTLNMDEVNAAFNGPVAPAVSASLVGLLLFIGAMGKSAQIPLHVWLPDAMAGPTPVSALIHAATMVTAGVYLVARLNGVYVHAPEASTVIATLGAATAFFAATVAIVQTDIKKVLAYSTLSQLGFMFVALGVGAYGVAVFHLYTHAFFKACLFLGAGSVIHALHHEQDMRHMGGLRKKIPITFATLACAWLAISGVPFTSGWYSKEAILGAVHHHSPWMYWVGVATAAVTAFYVSRSMFMTFWGEYKGHGHPHESPVSMWGPLAVLAVLSLGGGILFNVPHYLEPLFPSAGHGHDLMLEVIGSAAGLLGIGLAWFMYIARPGMADSIASSLGGFYRLVYNKYFVDEFYFATIIHPTVTGSRSILWRGLDAGTIDGAVNGVGWLSRRIGGVLRHLQSGNIRSYATWVVVGSVALIFLLGVAGGVR